MHEDAASGVIQLEDLSLEMQAAGFSEEKKVPALSATTSAYTRQENILGKMRQLGLEKVPLFDYLVCLHADRMHTLTARQALSPLFIETHRRIVENPL